jgi:hypothetical protein
MHHFIEGNAAPAASDDLVEDVKGFDDAERERNFLVKEVSVEIHGSFVELQAQYYVREFCVLVKGFQRK